MEPKGPKMEPKGSKREPKGTKMEPKGAKREPKGDQNALKSSPPRAGCWPPQGRVEVLRVPRVSFPHAPFPRSRSGFCSILFFSRWIPSWIPPFPSLVGRVLVTLRPPLWLKLGVRLDLQKTRPKNITKKKINPDLVLPKKVPFFGRQGREREGSRMESSYKKKRIVKNQTYCGKGCMLEGSTQTVTEAQHAPASGLTRPGAEFLDVF